MAADGRPYKTLALHWACLCLDVDTVWACRAQLFQLHEAQFDSLVLRLHGFAASLLPSLVGASRDWVIEHQRL